MHGVNIKQWKTHIRDKLKIMRENMDPESKSRMDSKVAMMLTSLWEYKQCETVWIYISKEIEVSTIAVIEDAWANKKRVAAPRCNKGTRTMKFYYINSFDDLQKASFGLYEPNLQICKPAKFVDGDICIVPGFAFDRQGYRLGYGYGYYDRFLSTFEGVKIGICYSDFIKFKLPTGRYDKQVDIIVTDKFTKNIPQNLEK